MRTINYFDMKSKTLTITVITTTTLITMMAVISYATGQVVNAQNMMKMGDRGDYGNKTSGQMINGTINLEQTIFQAIGSKVNTSLTQAITTAEQSIGNNSFALGSIWWTTRSLLGIYNNPCHAWNGVQ